MIIYTQVEVININHIKRSFEYKI